MKPQWTVAGGQNAGVFGRVYPVVIDAQLSPEDVFQLTFKPGPHETILCSSPDTARRIADWLNGQGEATHDGQRPLLADCPGTTGTGDRRQVLAGGFAGREASGMNCPPRFDRTFNRHAARVYLLQARVFKQRGQPFWRTLLAWARQARVDRGPQGEMF